MIFIPHFRKHVIRPACHALDMWSQEAEDLLLGTALVESRLFYMRQLEDGPALGFFQMEPGTHNDIWENFLRYRPKLQAKVMCVADRPQDMITNLIYAAMMARLQYFRDPEPIPDTPEGQAAYWKRVFNTHKGKGSPEKYLQAWRNQ